MTDNKKDDPGKGPVWPSDKRPHATIDVQATEVGGDKPKAAPGAGSALPPPQAAKPDAARSTFAGRLAAAGELSRRAAGSNSFLSHVAAGVAGAVLTLIAAALFGLFPSSGGGDEPGSADLAKRLAALEQAARQRPATPAGDVANKLAATDSRIK